jgi:hypothetical protein
MFIYSECCLIFIIINQLLILNAHITQEWQLIVNTPTTVNQIFFTTEIDSVHITNITII